MALDATAGGASANSYVTEADASTYLEDERLYVAEWTAATTADQEQALIWATSLLDFTFDWFGAPTDREVQALRWPRLGVWTDDNEYIAQTTIPKQLEDATAELGYDIIKTAADPTTESTLLGQGFKSVKVGPISLVLDPGQDVAELIPDIVKIMLNDLGTLKPIASKGTKVMKVRRA